MRVYQHAERDSSAAGVAASDALRVPLLSAGSAPLAEKPWLMKDPNHSKHLPELLAQFPDAKLIFTHRPPKDIIASLAKLFVCLTSTMHVPGAPGTSSEAWGQEA